MAFNLPSDRKGSFYFTLHLTSMSAPFYTSPKISNINPKWPEIELQTSNNSSLLSSSSIVIRIWLRNCTENNKKKHNIESSCCLENDTQDSIVLTWGVNFTGLVYLGHKISEIQPCCFKSNTVILYINGGYFTSHFYIRTDLKKNIPFVKNLNVIDTVNENHKVMYKKFAIKCSRNELQPSYNVEKLRRLQDLQFKIKNKSVEVQQVKDKINRLLCLEEGASSSAEKQVVESSRTSDNIRYAPQLLTMNSLNKMLHEKPTKFQKQEMSKTSKEIEISKFKNHLLAHEKDKKNVALRKLKDKLNKLTDENEERNSDLMENYHKLSKESEKLREYKRSLLHHRELLSQVNSQLQHRRIQLLQELLFIYPIKKVGDDRYTVLGVHLPNSDVLAECSDTGLSVALGYITHTLTMCATFLQVPLRYPMTHYGSRSSITDQVSLSLPDRERDFPLYTKGKEKAQFSYAVYLLNKNLAQLRWIFGLNTTDLKATLPNLLTFLNGPPEQLLPTQQHYHHSNKIIDVTEMSTTTTTATTNVIDKAANVKNAVENVDYSGEFKSAGNLHQIENPVEDIGNNSNNAIKMSGHSNNNTPVVSLSSLRNFSATNLSDTNLENFMSKQDFGNRVAGMANRRTINKRGNNKETGKGLSEILAIPEAYLNKQISKDSLENYMSAERQFRDIKVRNGLEERTPPSGKNPNNFEPIEQGTDPLDVTSLVSRSIKIHSEQHHQHLRLCTEENMLKHDTRISRSVGSYSDEDTLLYDKASFELGSEPILNASCITDGTITSKIIEHRDTTSLSSLKFDNCSSDQRVFLEQWLDTKNSPGKNSPSLSSPGNYSPSLSSSGENRDNTLANKMCLTLSSNRANILGRKMCHDMSGFGDNREVILGHNTSSSLSDSTGNRGNILENKTSSSLSSSSKNRNIILVDKSSPSWSSSEEHRDKMLKTKTCPSLSSSRDIILGDEACPSWSTSGENRYNTAGRRTSPSLSSSEENRQNILGRKTSFNSNPLTERTDRLLTTKSFNLVKPKLYEN